MRFNLATSRCSWAKFVGAVLAAIVVSPIVLAQPGLLIFGGPLPQAELSEPHIEVVSGPVAARLEQARALATAKNWDETVDIYRELAAEQTDRVVASDGGRYVHLGTYCQMQLAKLPPEALSAYRRRVDALAERWYCEGLAARDEQLLRRVASQFLCSSWGDDALLALGELALEQGEYERARRAWEQMSPLLRSPDGRSLWQALHGLDLAKNWGDIDRLWRERREQPSWLAYPDSQHGLAEIRARLILVSIRAGDFERAALELDAFRRWHPPSEGRLGGQQVVLASALERLLASAREYKAPPPLTDWPTFAGSQSRAAVAAPIAAALVPLWDRPIELAPPQFARRLVRAVQFGAQSENPHESGRPLSCFPAVCREQVLFADDAGVHAVALPSGEPLVTADGVIYRNESAMPEQQVGQFPLAAQAGVSHGVPRRTLNIVDDIVYGRVGALPTSRSELLGRAVGDRLVGLDLHRDGLLTFTARPDEASWAFDGTPVCDGQHLFVAMRHSGATPQAAVVCYDASTGNQLWRTPIVTADTPAGSFGDEITHNLLTLVGDQIYFNTNLGVVAAIDADDGKIRWLHKYQRWVGKPFTPGAAMPQHFDRDPSPCVCDDGVVFVAPADTPAVLALDANTGKILWANEHLPDALQLLGVTEQRLIVSGNRLASLDRFSGQIKWIWPESQTAGIRGMGRGILAGTEVLWPTRTEIYAIDAETGARTRSPISLSPASACGANLTAAAGRLIIAGYDKLMAYGPPSSSPQNEHPTNPENPPRTGRLSDQLPTQTKTK